MIPDEDAGTLSNDLEETATVGTSNRMKRQVARSVVSCSDISRASTKPVRALARVGKTKALRRRTVTSSEAGSELDDNSMLPTPVERSFGEEVALAAETPSAPPLVSLAERIKVLGEFTSVCYANSHQNGCHSTSCLWLLQLTSSIALPRAPEVRTG